MCGLGSGGWDCWTVVADVERAREGRNEQRCRWLKWNPAESSVSLSTSNHLKRHRSHQHCHLKWPHCHQYHRHSDNFYCEHPGSQVALMTLRKPFAGSQHYWHQAKNITPIPWLFDHPTPRGLFWWYGICASPAEIPNWEKDCGEICHVPPKVRQVKTQQEKPPLPKRKNMKGHKRDIYRISPETNRSLTWDAVFWGFPVPEARTPAKKRIWENVEGILYFLLWFDNSTW